MNRTIYAGIVNAIAPLLALRVRLRARSDAFYGAHMGERFGRYEPGALAAGRPVWVHAVSLGETRAAQPLVKALLDRGLPVLLTHMTATGRREGARLFAQAIEQGQLRQSWLPYDLPAACRRFYAAMQPRCGILIEREVWPNLIHAARQIGLPIALVSARLSERSARAGQRYGGSALRQAYAGLDKVLAQTEGDAQRLRASGARAVSVTGNIKFDAAVAPAQVKRGRAWKQAWHRKTIAIASTQDGEEAAFIAALAAHAPGSDALVVLIPRHPERFDGVFDLLQSAGLRTIRRSRIDPAQALPADTQVLLGDSMGEMVSYYAASDAAIVAGSFIAHGGQNLIEACATGTPVIVGPHTQNFEQATIEGIAAGAVLRQPDAASALTAAFDLLGDPDRREAMSQAGLRYVARHAGAVQRVLDAMAPMLGLAPTPHA
ncbi:3-deoxy-D-manno-octulosonic acid transferase [Bordetella sp. FB-8]|uniref:3-deoxy-D-manno-octulosonic acid transferase n=1 Tax=Bordetella sp. FB-8 TaxID=1159870 RepID=UPI00035FED45|nr:3-deoxy-D-manno-octulosonic acid transferase [Bordetella sp. FB-8]